MFISVFQYYYTILIIYNIVLSNDKLFRVAWWRDRWHMNLINIFLKKLSRGYVAMPSAKTAEVTSTISSHFSNWLTWVNNPLGTMDSSPRFNYTCMWHYKAKTKWWNWYGAVTFHLFGVFWLGTDQANLWLICWVCMACLIKLPLRLQVVWLTLLF